jgi:hypothetical protein
MMVIGCLSVFIWPGLDRAASPSVWPGEQSVQSVARLNPDGSNLIPFLRSRVLNKGARDELRALIRQLGDDSFEAREKASRRIVEIGSFALPFLKTAQRGAEPEVRRRLTVCIAEIPPRPSADTLAALRLWKHKPPKDGCAVLLELLPFASDQVVEDSAISLLSLQLARASGPERASVKAALSDSEPKRRAAAALALARGASPAELVTIRRLLQDPDAEVRLRAAQGLLSTGDQDAISALIELLQERQLGIADEAVDMLCWSTGEWECGADLDIIPPTATPGLQMAWRAWWRVHRGGSVLQHRDLAVASFGLTMRACCATHRFLDTSTYDPGVVERLPLPFYVRGSVARTRRELWDMFHKAGWEEAMTNLKEFGKHIARIPELRKMGLTELQVQERFRQLHRNELPIGASVIQGVLLAPECKDKDADGLGDINLDEVCIVRERNNVTCVTSIGTFFVRVTGERPHLVGMK